MKMNRTRNFYAICMLIAGLAFTACSKDDDGVKMANVTLHFNAPAELQNYNPVIGIQKLVLKNINTGAAITVPQASIGSSTSVAVSVPEGLYSINMEGSLNYKLNETAIHTKIRAYQESVTLTEAGVSSPISITGYVYNDSKEGSGFVIAEIFFTGTETPEKKQYNGDKYFRIYNNSGDTLCADGLTIAESEFITTKKYEYTPNIMNEAFTTDVIYRIPTGKKLMVAPGKSLLICDIGMNHTTVNPNSFDLTKADFEWYDKSSNPKISDTDTPVPNMEKIYSYSPTVWTPHNRGFKSYVLARLGDDENNQLSAEQYLKDYTYEYSYELIINGNVRKVGPKKAYKIPNKWILDAVNLSVESEREWNLVSPSLDKGWTYCGKVDKDATRYGKSVRRKVLSGKTLQDTNDSTVDFLPEQKADPYFKFHE